MQNSVSSGFTEASAADAWDSWFRWRDGYQVRDRDVDATWKRVAWALATAEHDHAGDWTPIFFEALNHLRVLPDERILAAAGTGRVGWPTDALHAAANVSAYVRDPYSPRSRLDVAALERDAGVAVRMLDDAIELHPTPPEKSPRLRVSIVGLADALTMLGIPYDSAEARHQAELVAAALSRGSRTMSMRLARERGLPWLGVPYCGCDREGCATGHAHGPRHASLTSLLELPRLARLANNVASGLGPVAAPHHQLAPWLARLSAPTAPDRSSNAQRPSDRVQQDLRNAMAPWIDDAADRGTSA